MEHSATIGKLTEALSKAQGVIEGAKLDSTNPFFKSRYSDLTSVWASCRKPLAENGLAVFQTCCSDTPDIVVVETMLSHISGEWVRGRLTMKPAKNDPQSIGSCITYGRRYSLAAMVGIAPEDDDGNVASGREEQKPVTKPPVREEQKPATKPPVKDNTISRNKEALRMMMVKAGITDKAEQLKFYSFVMSGKGDDFLPEFIAKFDQAHQTYKSMEAAQ
jgi:hypothetical protein